MPKVRCPGCGHECWVERRLFAIASCPQCSSPFLVGERGGAVEAEPALCAGCDEDVDEERLARRWDTPYGWRVLCSRCEAAWEEGFPTMTLEGAVERLREGHGLARKSP